MLAWAANLAAIAGLWRVGGGHRDGFLIGFAGCVLWTAEGLRLAHSALIFIEVLLAALYIRGFLKCSTGTYPS